MQSTDPKIGVRPIVQALEDALVVGVLALLGTLVAHADEFPPEYRTLYGAGLAGLLAGAVAYARARQIQGRG